MKNNYHRNRLSTDSMIWLLRSLPVLPALLFLTLAGPTTKSVCAREQPNIVILFADDMGFSDIGCFGAHQPGGKMTKPHLTVTGLILFAII